MFEPPEITPVEGAKFHGEVPSEFLWRSSLMLARKADEVGRVQGLFLIASMLGVLCLLVAVVTWMWGHS